MMRNDAKKDGFMGGHRRDSDPGESEREKKEKRRKRGLLGLIAPWRRHMAAKTIQKPQNPIP
jgi:hypothetical protein